MPNTNIIPTSRSGNYGWTLCCDAAATITDDGALVCKACLSDLRTTPPIFGLDLLLANYEAGNLTVTQAIQKQHQILDKLTDEHFAPFRQPFQAGRAFSSRPNRPLSPTAQSYLSRWAPGVGTGR